MDKKYKWLIAFLVLSAITLAVGGGMFLQKTTSENYETVDVPVAITESPVLETEKGLAVVTGEAESTASETAEAVEKEALVMPPVLLFAGDVLLSDHVLNAYEKAGGIHGVLDDGFLADIREADIFMANQEFPFSDRGSAAADKQYTFRLPPERVSLLKEMEIDIVTLANNHVLDFGRDALLDTGMTLDGAGIRYVGAGENLDRAKRLEIMEIPSATNISDSGGQNRAGIKIGFLAASRVIPESGWNANSYTPGLLTTYDPAALVGEIEKAKDLCDYVVVYVHWGIERAERPEEYQRALGKQYIDAGADMVIGSHPHVLQGIEYYDGKPMVYSLGNFVFGSSIPKTALLKVSLKEEGMELSLIPGTSNGGYTRKISGDAELAEFYRYMEGISYGIKIVDGVVVPEQAQP